MEPGESRRLAAHMLEGSTPWWPLAAGPAGAPDVIVVLLDDAGSAQFGCYGRIVDLASRYPDDDTMPMANGMLSETLVRSGDATSAPAGGTSRRRATPGWAVPVNRGRSAGASTLLRLHRR
jgi:hypothetical protein